MAKNRKYLNLGEVVIQTDPKTGAYDTVDGSPDGVPKRYSMKVYVPDDVDQAGIGEPSLVLKRGDFINFAYLTEEDLAKFPDWKKKIAQLRAWVSNRDFKE
jgi:hypothetical protein